MRWHYSDEDAGGSWTGERTGEAGPVQMRGTGWLGQAVGGVGEWVERPMRAPSVEKKPHRTHKPIKRIQARPLPHPPVAGPAPWDASNPNRAGHDSNLVWCRWPACSSTVVQRALKPEEDAERILAAIAAAPAHRLDRHLFLLLHRRRAQGAFCDALLAAAQPSVIEPLVPVSPPPRPSRPLRLCSIHHPTVPGPRPWPAADTHPGYAGAGLTRTPSYFSPFTLSFSATLACLR